ncbi:phosphatidylinositol N-acetylglucosaminyltransferase subunit H [Scheffersomyces xylosifermentans]|uniref:phosphatidylinositol N-acetylglucosaminyltransferase subunit H n=1 Tax=Scheffersomyces xylosifermentans TaxID=1304137 RepID=UPI00315DA8D2
MSSPKDYVLEITPSIGSKPVETLNLLKFTVKNKKDDVLTRYQVHLVVVLSSILLGYLKNQIKTDDIVSLNYKALALLSTTQISIILGLITLLALVSSKQVPEDTVTVMKGIGIQLSSKKAWRFQNQKESFIPLNSTIDLVIHEGFHKYGQVIFYLCILTRATTSGKKNNDNIIKVAFPEFLPRKDILLEVWKMSRVLLFGDTKRYWRRVPGQGLKQVH